MDHWNPSKILLSSNSEINPAISSKTTIELQKKKYFLISSWHFYRIFLEFAFSEIKNIFLCVNWNYDQKRNKTSEYVMRRSVVYNRISGDIFLFAQRTQRTRSYSWNNSWNKCFKGFPGLYQYKFGIKLIAKFLFLLQQ